MENAIVTADEEKVIETSVEELRQQAKEIYAKLVVAHDKKDWLNFSVLSDQLSNIKSDLDKIENDSLTSEVIR